MARAKSASTRRPSAKRPTQSAAEDEYDRIDFRSLCHFNPKQLEAAQVADSHLYTLFGGSRGPGKSYFLRWYMLARTIKLCQRYGLTGVRTAIFCEDYPSLKDRQISKISLEFPAWLGEVKDTQEDGFGFRISGHYGGGFIALRNLDDVAKYKSAEFASIGIDELTMNRVEVFDILRGSLRWAGIPGSEWHMVGASNPDGIGNLWVKDYFIDKLYPPELEPYRDHFAFVPALPDDNPHLDAAYWQMLNSLPPDLARAWRWGEWDVFLGQVFKTFRRMTHVIEPFDIPAHWTRWRGIDWGKRNPFCCLWIAKEPDTGRLYVYRELYQAGLDDRAQARAVRDNTLAGERIAATFADPSMWTKKTFENKVYSTADEYAAERVYLTKADNDRMTGKRKIDTLLSNLPDGKPWLMVFSTCANLIRTLPALPYAKVGNPEDVDSDAEDHAYDGLRYCLTQISTKPQVALAVQQQLAGDPIARLLTPTGNMGGKDF